MGFFKALDALIIDLGREFRRQSESFFRYQDPMQRMEDELRLMFGRGVVSEEEYQALRKKLAKRQIASGDLAVIRSQASGKNAGKAGYRYPEISQALDRLIIERIRVEETRREAQQDLDVLEVDLQELRNLAQQAGEADSRAMPEEDETRRRLQEKHLLLERVAALEERQQSLESTLQRLAGLTGELEASQVELKALHSEARLVNLETSVRKTLAVV